MSRLKHANDEQPSSLAYCDRCVFKLAWCVSLKNKSASSRVVSFTQALSNGAPDTLQPDKDTAVFNRPLQKVQKSTDCITLRRAKKKRMKSLSRGSIGLIIHARGNISRTPVGLIRRLHAGLYATVHRDLSAQCRYQVYGSVAYRRTRGPVDNISFGAPVWPVTMHKS